MKQINIKLQRTKALALVLGTLGLMLAPSQSAWAEAKKGHRMVARTQRPG